MLFKIIRSSRLSKWSRIGALALGGILLTGCASLESTNHALDTQPLTAITDSPTNAYHSGQFVWFDLLTADVESAKTFYGELFGWSFEQQGRYAMIMNNGHRIAGILEVAPKDGEYAEPLWLGSLSVVDVDKAVAYVKEQGGKALKGPLQMENRGRGALVSDPQGAQLILLRATGGDPPDDEPEIGDWVWNEIWSNEPHETSRFYQSMGGYDSIQIGDDYEILLNDGKWHAGIRYIVKDGHRTRWVPVVRVSDTGALLDKVEALGGVVWLRPDEAPSNGDTALISDKNGALLMIQRWSSEQMEETQ